MADIASKKPWWRTPAALIGAGAVAALGLGIGGGALGAVIVDAGRGPGACDAVVVTERALPSIVTVWAGGQRGSGNGSGVILTADGLIVTNDHVITPALDRGSVVGTLAVSLADGERIDAALVGRDPQTDLAVLRIERDGDLPAVRFGSSGEVRTGQPVVALGAPLGLSNSVTAGIVSALGRSVTLPTGDGGVTVVTGAVQTDAAINPGNSGGALVDCRGRLIGINTAISTVPGADGVGGGGSVGIGYAVPVDTVRAITEELIANGRVDHPSFGVEVAQLSAPQAAQFGVPPGLVITGVIEGGSAELAGLRVGDLIVRLGSRTAPTAVTLADATVRAAPGDTIEVEYVREGRTSTVTVTLQPDPVR